MSKRVVLVYPLIIKGWQAQPRVEIPMGLLCIATPVVSAGYDVKIIDQRVEPKWRSILEQELQKDPLCVGVSSMTGPQLRYALEISKMVKAYEKVPVVWGGIHPTILPDQTLRNEFIDFIVQGEGEEAFLEIVQALEGKKSLGSVKGIWYKEYGQIKNTGTRPLVDLNRQPPLEYHLIDLKKYLRVISGVEHLNFYTSRGCPNSCTFCFTGPFNSKRWRGMDSDIAVQRIKNFVQTYHVKGLTLIDNNFFMDMERGRRLLKGLIREDLRIVISKMSIHPDTLLKMNDDDFALLEQAGCRRLIIAVESGSERIRALIKKPVDVPGIRELNRRLKNSLLAPSFLFMMGLPTETKEDLAESVSLVLRLLEENPKANTFFNIYTPFPGTELFDVTVKHGLRPPERLENWFSFNYRNLTLGAPWLSEEMRNIVEMLDFCTFFIGKGPFSPSYEKTGLLVSGLCKIYASLANKRVKHLGYQFPVEIKLAKFFGLYAKQD